MQAESVAGQERQAAQESVGAACRQHMLQSNIARVL